MLGAKQHLLVVRFARNYNIVLKTMIIGQKCIGKDIAKSLKYQWDTFVKPYKKVKKSKISGSGGNIT